jgi:hypothetical protein
MNKIKQLNKAYTKRFKRLTKDILNTDAGLTIFVEHLKYLRDTAIVNQRSADVIATLNAAIEEAEAFKQNHKAFHWNNFCEFVKLNMREWVLINDSV